MMPTQIISQRCLKCFSTFVHLSVYRSLLHSLTLTPFAFGWRPRLPRSSPADWRTRSLSPLSLRRIWRSSKESLWPFWWRGRRGCCCCAGTRRLGECFSRWLPPSPWSGTQLWSYSARRRRSLRDCRSPGRRIGCREKLKSQSLCFSNAHVP